MSTVRDAIRQQVRLMVGPPSRAREQAPEPAAGGDAGLFGPRSVTWRVHGDFTSMMVGGVSSLLLQMLHPGALAGVWDHSNFRSDAAGRLQRTAQFVGLTTYGSTAQATAMVARVRAIHSHVRGTLPDGTPYSANDPDLLAWVHNAEVRCFLAAYLRYRDPSMPRADQDRYVAEMARLARLLGAEAVPVTRAGLEAYLRDIRPRLRADHRTRSVADALLGQPAPSRFTEGFRDMTMEAGVDLLPDWAVAMHGFHLGQGRRYAVRTAVEGVGAVLRWAMREDGAPAGRARGGAVEQAA